MLETREELEAALTACDTHRGCLWVDSSDNLGPLGAGLAVREPSADLKELTRFRDDQGIKEPQFTDVFGLHGDTATLRWAQKLRYHRVGEYMQALVEPGRLEVKRRIQKLINKLGK